MPVRLILAVVIVIAILANIIRVLFFAKPKEKVQGIVAGSEPEEEKEDPQIVAEIEKAGSAEDLMDIVGKYDHLFGKENDVFLARATLFGNELREHDWADIYCVAGDGSELERVAKEKAGDELDMTGEW